MMDAEFRQWFAQQCDFVDQIHGDIAKGMRRFSFKGVQFLLDHDGDEASIWLPVPSEQLAGDYTGLITWVARSCELYGRKHANQRPHYWEYRVKTGLYEGRNIAVLRPDHQTPAIAFLECFKPMEQCREIIEALAKAEQLFDAACKAKHNAEALFDAAVDYRQGPLREHA